METVVLNVEGMTCAHCEMSVSRELRKVPGVRDAVVSAKAGSATVTYDPSQATLQALEAAVQEAGYSVAGTATAGSAPQATSGHQHDHGRGGGHGHGCCH